MPRRLIVPVVLAVVAGVALERVSSANDWGAIAVAAVGVVLLIVLLGLGLALALQEQLSARYRHLRAVRDPEARSRRAPFVATATAVAIPLIAFAPPGGHQQLGVTTAATSVPVEMTVAHVDEFWRQAPPPPSKVTAPR